MSVKYLTAVAAIILSLFTAGCEDIFSSSSSDDPFIFNDTRFVNFKSVPTPAESADGAITILQCGDLRVYVMDYTSVSRFRDSCSGFDNSVDIAIGDLIEFYYADEHVDWVNGIVKPLKIEAIPASCVQVYAPDYVCEPCNE